MRHILMNPKSNNGRGEQEVREYCSGMAGIVYHNVLEMNDKKIFFDSLNSDDEVFLFGGDGTLNHFINDLRGYNLKNQVYYVKSGSGNDFYRDAEKYAENDRIHLNRFMENLPVVNVNGMERAFINGIGYGIDGETCRLGDIQRKKSDKPVNYGNIAVKLCLYAYRKNKATIIVDGKTYEYKDVWIAATMKGRYYGGGMMIAPQQDRFNPKDTVSVVCLHKRSRLVTLMRFPSIFKGEHSKWADWCDILEGKHVQVTFEYPCALQIDGEVIPDVLSYTVKA